MRYIALFFPAVISVGIKYKRGDNKQWTWFDYVWAYAVSVICNVLFTESVISYALRLGGVTIEAFDSFPFFTKYLFIATVLAVIAPYISEIVRKNIAVSFEVEKKGDGKE